MRDGIVDVRLNSIGTAVSMYADTREGETFVIYPASTPSAIRFYESYKRGEPLTRIDAYFADDAASHEAEQALPWLITHAEIVTVPVIPVERSWRELVFTFEAGPLKIKQSVWPPRMSSGVLFLKAVQAGKQLGLKDFNLLRKFIREEARQAGMRETRGVLDWNPKWEDFL